MERLDIVIAELQREQQLAVSAPDQVWADHFDDVQSTGVYRLGINGLQPRSLSRADIRRHIRKRAERLSSIEAAYAEFRDQIVANSGTAKFCLVLAGLEVEERILLTPGFTLQPVNTFVFSSWATETINKGSGYMALDGTYLQPRSVLVWTLPYEPAFATSPTGSEQPSEHQRDRLNAAANLLAVVVGSPLGAVLAWISDDDELLPSPGDGMIFRDFGWGLVGAINSIAQVSSYEVAEYFMRYEHFKGCRRALDLATGRLTRCLSIGKLEDRAIDLGVALEALLMFQNNAPNESFEITYKLGSRAVWLLGGSISERHANFKVIQDVYALRSRAGHGGHLGPKKLSEINQQLSSGVLLARKVIQAILDRSDWPNWKSLVLGGDEPTYWVDPVV